MDDVVIVERLPFGKAFAVSLVDDTDGANVCTTRRAYELLAENGILCTKTVWPFEATALSGGYERLRSTADTLQVRPYRLLCERLHETGFEIALHTASAGDSTREETIAAYDLFESIFGHPPATNIMHGRNRENIYWGKHAFPDGVWKRLTARLEPTDFAGHQLSSPFYWGDLCRERSRYVRQFETLSVDTLRFDPATPYHDADKPDVPWWFSASYGASGRLVDLFSGRNVDRLATARGVSIVHTYLHDYVADRGGEWGELQFRAMLARLAARSDGWYVPVATLLDRMRAVRTIQVHVDDASIALRNASDVELEDLAIRAPDGLVDFGGGERRDAFGAIRIGTVPPGGEARLATTRRARGVRLPSSPPPDYRQLAAGHARRVAWQFQHGRRAMVGWRR
jgi:hypothetical protein